MKGNDRRITVDVVLICYNQEQYIEQAIDSIIFQRTEDYFTIRVLVADDCSSDNTLSIIKKKQSESSFEFVYLTADRGLGMQLNYKRAFEFSNADYVAILEGDDYWTDPYRIKKHVDFLDQHRECSMSANRFVQYFENTRKFSTISNDNSFDMHYVTGNDMALGNKLGNLSACVIRKSALDKIDPIFYDLKFADWLLGLTISQYGLIAIINQIMSVYRVNQNGQWSKLNADERIESMLKGIDAYDIFLEHIYQKEFNECRNRLLGIKSQNGIRYYMPPFIFMIYDMLMPIAVSKSFAKLFRR